MIATLLLASTLLASPVVARIGETPITADELGARARALGKAPSVAVLDTLVEEALMTAEGYRLGLDADAGIRRAVEAHRRRLAAERLVETGIRSAVVVTDEVISDLFHASADRVTLEMLAFPTAQEASAALAKLEQGATMEELSPGAIDLPEMRGKVTTRTRGSLRRQVADAVFAAPMKRYFGPVDLAPGHAVVRVLERTVGSEAELAARRDGLRAFARRSLASEMQRHLVEQLRKSAPVTVDEPFLASTGNAVEVEPALLQHVVARAGGREVKYADVVAEIRRMFGRGASAHLTGKGMKVQLAQALADGALLEEEALRRGLGGDPQVEEAVRREERALVGQRYLAALREAVPEPAEADVAAYHAEHAAAFTLPAQRRCSHILLPSRERAAELREKIRSDDDFAAAARQHSLDVGTRDEGGCICELPDERLEALARTDGAKELAKALRGATPGSTSEPVKSGMGWHLVRCRAPTPARLRPLDETRVEIVRILRERAGAAATKARLAQLRQKTPVVVDESALAAAADS